MGFIKKIILKWKNHRRRAKLQFILMQLTLGELQDLQQKVEKEHPPPFV